MYIENFFPKPIFLVSNLAKMPKGLSFFSSRRVPIGESFVILMLPFEGEEKENLVY